MKKKGVKDCRLASAGRLNYLSFDTPHAKGYWLVVWLFVRFFLLIVPGINNVVIHGYKFQVPFCPCSGHQCAGDRNLRGPKFFDGQVLNA